MYRPWCKIEIGQEKFAYVTQGEVNSTWKKFTDTMTMQIPRKIVKNGQPIYVGQDNVFKKGDAVKVFAGYFPKSELIFEGYLTKITPKEPIEMEFEDPSWILKQTNLTISFKNITLKDLLQSCISEAISKSTPSVAKALKKIDIKCVEAKFWTFRLTNVNIVQVLDELKKTYALTSFFRNQTLYVGLAYYADGVRHKFTFGENIFDDNLEYKKQDDIKIKVKAVSMLENNTKLEAEVGDYAGEQRTIFAYNVKNLSELKAIAQREKDRLVYEGFYGKFRTFLTSVVKHGDEIELVNKKYPEQNGVYYAEAVNVLIGIDGYFQDITLGAKISV